jgi:3-deoxy-D-manno-octulosonic-acid transferase
VIVAGSSWAQDETILASVFRTMKNEFRLIVVPHEIDQATINSTQKRFSDFAVTRYSQVKDNFSDADVLIIDNIGMLSSLYRYADLAYIGGGFGKGIHNILEAAVFGIPVFFGPNYKKFREARELIHWKGVFSIKNNNELLEQIRRITSDPQLYNKIREINLKYIDNNKGATDLIIEHLKMQGFE